MQWDNILLNSAMWTASWIFFAEVLNMPEQRWKKFHSWEFYICIWELSGASIMNSEGNLMTKICRTFTNTKPENAIATHKRKIWPREIIIIKAETTLDLVGKPNSVQKWWISILCTHHNEWFQQLVAKASPPLDIDELSLNSNC